MKMKNHLKTNTIRAIKKSFPRFLSLIIMSFLGVLVFVGLTSTSPDMLNTLDKFLDDYNSYDFKIISTGGLTEDDLKILKETSNVKEVEGVYSKDILLNSDASEIVLNISSLPNNINKLELVSGSLPIANNEITVEDNFLTKLGYEIGDKIEIIDSNIKEKEFIIVGSVRSPLYFSNTAVNQNRGVTTIGSGTINYYSYILSSAFDSEIYTNAYLTVDKAKDLITSTNIYLKTIDDVQESINSLKKVQEQKRYDKIYNDANNEILKNEQKSNKELKDAKIKLDNAKKELDKVKKELDKANTDLVKAKKELDKANQNIETNKKEFNNNLKKYGISNLAKSINENNANINKIEELLKNTSPSSAEYQIYVNNLENLKKQAILFKTLDENQKKLDEATKTLKQNNTKYKSSLKSYQEGLNIYNKNLKKYKTSLSEYEENELTIKKELEDAKEELEKLKTPVWYIYDRSDDQTYSSYINQVDSLKNLANLFPVVFYVVAILVSLVSMNRMIEDDRGEIGTLKSLGFSNNEIKYKYLLFSGIGASVGALFGVIVGLTIIPYLIFTIYRLLFDVPNFQFGLNLLSTLMGIIIALLCICGSSLITANKVLKEKPSNLMRPKVPASGQNILLERITPLWQHLKFSNKVTIRNIFRYKKRVLVTIFGICGCTALILCGFGIKDSIVDITNMQYVKTFKYDVTVYLDNLKNADLLNIVSDEKINDYTLAEIITGTIENSNVNILAVEKEEEINKIVNLVSNNNEKIKLKNNSAIITDKIADIYKIKVNDKIKIFDSNKKEYTFIVSDIVKNYMGHYIYVSKEAFENSSEEINYKPNIMYLNTNPLSLKEKEEMSNSLIANESVINVIHTNTLIDSVKDMLNSLDKVVIILILLSAMLSFVVLYNLSNINIAERTREIATLKVLGFYNKEVNNYITNETIILTIIGIILGLGFGYILTNLTIGTVEMENARFIRNISLKSYLYATLISSIFTIIVNYVTHFALKRIDMIESLKSVE